MKKLHIILLIITLILAIFSVYSLAAINQVYKIDFEWYSQYNKNFSDEARLTSDYKWILSRYPDKMMTEIFTDRNSIISHKDENLNATTSIINFNFQNDVMLYCSLDRVNSPEYKIKVIDIAQRGNVVEIKLSLNGPARINRQVGFNNRTYLPVDIIRISKASFVTKGKLFFIFKNQAGNKIAERSCTV